VSRHHRRVHRLLLVVALTGLSSLAIASPSVGKRTNGGGYTLVQNATLVSPGDASPRGAEASSTGPDPFTWGAIDFAVPPGLKLRRLTNLSTDYKFVVGSCWGGSPRFEAWVNDGTSTRKIFFYIGPPPDYTGCASAVYLTSGNLAAPTSQVDASQIGGSAYEPYSDVQARFGDYTVTKVTLGVDGGWYSNQTVDFDNTVVNQQLVTYEG